MEAVLDPALLAAFEWGSRDERLDVLEHGPERAYRFDELRWWANLTLLLAATGAREEAFSTFHETPRFISRVPKDRVWLDELTNLIEAAALLGDPDRLAACHCALRWPDGRVVVVGNGIVCKGSVDRYKALGYAALGKGKQADLCFPQGRHAPSGDRGWAASGPHPPAGRLVPRHRLTLRHRARPAKTAEGGVR